MRLFFITLFQFVVYSSFSQNLIQTIRGKVLDKDSKTPLIGVTVSVGVGDNIKSASTDDQGNFRIEGVSVGRQNISFSYMGYKPVVMENVLVFSAKELVLNVEMEEALQQLDEVTISATKKDGTVNDMTIVSGRSFTVEEADKYAASRQDPARMAGNFAGVNSTSDARNDIVIRGNSPMGLLWRLNNVDIPNPSHFAAAGSTGGPISIINTKFLATSDFMTGAFPAEYGNANAGVFDLTMRNGNNEKYEFTGQLGILGTELAAEGPFSKKSKASFLATFRYSTLEILQRTLNFSIGTDAVPRYGDASFKLNFPTKKAGTFSLFGIGGISTIDIVLSDTTIYQPAKLKKNQGSEELYGDQTRDQYFRTRMGVVGAQHVYSLTSKAYLSSTIAHSIQNINSTHFYIDRDSAFRPRLPLPRITGNNQTENRTSVALVLNKKIDARSSYKMGIYASMYNFDFIDSVRFSDTAQFKVRADYQGSFFLIQPFTQYKYKLKENFTIHAGLHAQYLTLNNNSYSLEPRAGFNWNFKPKHTLSFGYGLHSQMQPLYVYFARVNTSTENTPNREMGFTRSQHFVLGYDFVARRDLRFKVETYYQNLWGIPVYPFPSGVSMINQGATFTRFFPKTTLVNAGLARNYGIEFTAEKFFSSNYYVLWTTSLYQSEYKGSDNVWRSTDFNGNYITNMLAGYELPLGKSKRTVLVTGTKFTYAGGRRYTEADIDSSFAYLDYQPKEGEFNKKQFSDYIRFDIRLGVRINAKRTTHELIIDLINVLNTRNPLALTFSPNPNNKTANPIKKNYQLGFLPLFYYKIDF